MLQTSPSGASPGILSLDNSAKPSGTQASGDADGFSQEYDKQVKNIESSEKQKEPEESRPAAAQAKAEAAEKPEPKTGTEAAANNEAGNGEGQAANDEGQGGNNLPLEQMRKLAAEAQLQAESSQQDENTELAAQDESLEEAELLAQQATQQEDEALTVVANAPLQDSARSAVAHAVAATLKEGAAPASGKTVTSAELLRGDEVVVEEGESTELPELQLKQRAKGEEFASLLARQPNQPKGEAGGEAMSRGGRGLESLLNTAGRATPTAASVDTLSPTLAPLAGQGAVNALATPAPVAMSLATPMHQANWGGAVAERVVWMTNANIQEAEIQLNPRELGPIGIKVTVSNEQTHVSFVAQNATTREALEQAIPRLREMLGENGLQLGQSDVSQHSFKGRDGQDEGSDGEGCSAHHDEALEGEEVLLGEATAHGVGYVGPAGLDAFA